MVIKGCRLTAKSPMTWRWKDCQSIGGKTALRRGCPIGASKRTPLLTRRTQDWNHRQDGLEWTLRPGLALLWEELVITLYLVAIVIYRHKCKSQKKEFVFTLALYISLSLSRLLADWSWRITSPKPTSPVSFWVIGTRRWRCVARLCCSCNFVNSCGSPGVVLDLLAGSCLFLLVLLCNSCPTFHLFWFRKF